jgi:hypothetical protein
MCVYVPSAGSCVRAWQLPDDPPVERAHALSTSTAREFVYRLWARPGRPGARSFLDTIDHRVQSSGVAREAGYGKFAKRARTVADADTALGLTPTRSFTRLDDALVDDTPPGATAQPQPPTHLVPFLDDDDRCYRLWLCTGMSREEFLS